MTSIDQFNGEERLPDEWRGCVVALGNFDGVHLGHQAVVNKTIEIAGAEGRKAIIATFDPHPMRYFKPDLPPFRLTSIPQRQQIFAKAGADAILVFPFNARFASRGAAEFVSQILAENVGAAHLVTGQDFTFGKGRDGNIDSLRTLGAEYGMQTTAVEAVMVDGKPVSSTRIRKALQEGRPEDAAALMTRPFAVAGTVQHGDKVGREIGFPTANIDMGKYLRPAFGIYAVTGHLPDGRVLHGAANMGIRPSFDPPKELLEPYFFDFSEDLYGQEIEVAFHHYIRPEAKFDGLDALIEQMHKDCDVAREWLAKNAPLA